MNEGEFYYEKKFKNDMLLSTSFVYGVYIKNLFGPR